MIRYWLVAGLVLLAACGEAGPPDESVLGPQSLGGEGDLVRCSTLTSVVAPETSYRDSPIYVANEMPVEEVQQWAATQPGFEDIWIDREHNGWITVAFSVDAEARQDDLEIQFPDVGVVAVAVDWRSTELRRLQQEVNDSLGGDFAIATWVDVTTGFVGVDVGVLAPERVDAVAASFGGERVCIEGVAPEAAPEPGTQAPEGDGWRLLAAAPRIGVPYRTGVAADASAYRALWETVGLPDAPPPVDFTDEIVIWFGAVFGSSCPDLRLDDVVVDADRAIVHADIVLADPPAACTSDANPYAFVVALARTRLPRGSFAIQLDADGPPAGAPEERTLVGVDLSAPGATAGPGDLTSGTAPPAPGAIPAGSTIEPGVEHAYRLDTHCGVDWLGELNGVRWRADPDDSSLDTVWQAWQQLAGEGEVLDLVLVLDVTAAPRITARAGGDELIYMPTNEPVPPCD